MRVQPARALVTTAAPMFSAILRRARRARRTMGTRARRSLVNSATSAASTAIAAPAQGMPGAAPHQQAGDAASSSCTAPYCLLPSLPSLISIAG